MHLNTITNGMLNIYHMDAYYEYIYIYIYEYIYIYIISNQWHSVLGTPETTEAKTNSKTSNSKDDANHRHIISGKGARQIKYTFRLLTKTIRNLNITVEAIKIFCCSYLNNKFSHTRAVSETYDYRLAISLSETNGTAVLYDYRLAISPLVTDYHIHAP